MQEDQFSRILKIVYANSLLLSFTNGSYMSLLLSNLGFKEPMETTLYDDPV